MTTDTTAAQQNKKIPIKFAEISIQKFNENGIPHHVSLLKNHKSNIEKCVALGDWEKIKKEEINATRVVKQLKSLLIEMNNLRDKIQLQDLKQFDEMVFNSRQIALAEINGYLAIHLKSPSSSKSSARQSFAYEDDDYNDTDEIRVQHLQTKTLPKLQTDFELNEHQLRQRQSCLDEMENLQREVTDLHGIFHQLHNEVHVQGEMVDKVEDNVEVAEIQVAQAEKSLRQALSYKKAMYPVCGALIGTCLGGPIGLFAGLKAGGLAAVGCGILGFSGGAAIKNHEQQSVQEINQINEAQVAIERKDE